MFDSLDIPYSLRSARASTGLTQAEAGQLVGVTAKAWSAWETGIRKMPYAAYELFMHKAAGDLKSPVVQCETNELVVVCADDGRTPLAVFGSRNFLSFKTDPDLKTGVISSWVMCPRKGAERFSCRFNLALNKHVVASVTKWQSELKD